MNQEAALKRLSREVIACRLCPRLVEYRERVAREKRRAYIDWEYWGKPVSGFGDPQAKLLIVGLAPAAHGGNRTGRVFTGDRSGDFLFAALYEAGFANQPTSLRRDDGLRLINSYITATARCAPPDNKPLPGEILNCRGYMEREIRILQPKAVLALGRIAWDAYLEVLKQPQAHNLARPLPFLAWSRNSTARLRAALVRRLSSQPAKYPNRPRNSGHVRRRLKSAFRSI